MPRGRPAKTRTIDEYFKSMVGSNAWSKGYRAFQFNYGKKTIQDGIHNVRLIDGRFEAPAGSSAHNAFVFQFPDGSTFEKATLLTSGEGVAAFLTDLKLLGFNVPNWAFLPAVYLRIRETKPSVSVVAKTTEGMQDIRIVARTGGPVELDPPEPPELAQVALTPAVVVESIQPEIVSPAPVAPQIQELPVEVAKNEVEIGPGDTIRASVQGQEVVCQILNEFPNEMKFLVQTVSGQTIFVPAGDVIAKL